MGRPLRRRMSGRTCMCRQTPRGVKVVEVPRMVRGVAVKARGVAVKAETEAVEAEAEAVSGSEVEAVSGSEMEASPRRCD